MHSTSKQEQRLPRYFNVGRLLRREGLSWFDVTELPDWEEWSSKQTKDQLNMLKRGFDGWHYPLELLPKKQTEGIFPFGLHKGKPMNEVPLDYYHWCSTMSWMEKYPIVLAYIAEHKEEIINEVKDIEQIYKELKDITK